MNQRRFPRVNYNCLLRVSAEDGVEEVLETVTDNIGAGGIACHVSKEFKLFDTVGIELYPGDREAPVFCDGTVVWVVKNHPMIDGEELTYDIGVEFKDLKDPDRSRIEGLVRSILEAQS